MDVNTKASKQLFSRPADETFKDWNSLIESLQDRDNRTVEHAISNLQVYPDRGNLNVEVETESGREGKGKLNDWSFSMLCALAKAPKSYLNTLPSDLASDCLNSSLNRQVKKPIVANVLLPKDSNAGELPLIRGFYSKKYKRVSDLTVAKHYHRLATEFGYQPAGAFAGKRIGMPPVRPEASGLYAGDRDMFLFLANEDGAIEIDGESTIYHCVQAWNSEVTAARLGNAFMGYNAICGNHMVWGIKDFEEKTAKHMGNPEKILSEAELTFIKVQAQRDELQYTIHNKVREAQRKEFGKTREDVKKRLQEYVTRKEATNIMNWTEHPTAYPKSPNSYWGVAQGITLFSQTFPNENNRRSMDKIAQNILSKVEVVQ